jgi:flagellar biosynthesis anti-sigma factor FlgM
MDIHSTMYCDENWLRSVSHGGDGPQQEPHFRWKIRDMTNPPSASAEDVAHLPTVSDAVQTLKAQLDKVPEIRQQKVDSLKQAIAEGRHRRDPRQIAAAMFADGILSLG